VAAYVTLENMELHHYLIGTFALITLFGFTLFNDFEKDSISGSLCSLIHFFYKTFLVFIFREKNYGLEELDCEG